MAKKKAASRAQSKKTPRKRTRTSKAAQQATAVMLRRVTVAKLYIEGETQAAIAERCNVSRSQIFQDLVAIRDEWASHYAREYDQWLHLELSKLDQIEREAWAAYERSQQPRETERTEVEEATEEEPGKTKTVTMVEGRDGNPQFLAVALKAHENRVKLLDLLNEERWAQASAGAQGKDVKHIEVVVESREEVAAVMKFADYLHHVEAAENEPVEEDDDDPYGDFA